MSPTRRTCPPLRLTACIVTLGGVLTAELVAASPAAADPLTSYPIAWAPIGIYPRADHVWSADHVGAAIPNGTTVAVECESEGQSVTSAAGTSVIWDRLAEPAGAWVPNVFLDTGFASWTDGLPRCADLDAARDTAARATDRSSSEGRYDRAGAAAWARDNAKTLQPRYRDNCTWFQSNAAWQGGLPKSADWTDNSHDLGRLASRWDVVLGGPTRTATLADAFKNLMTDSGYATISQPLDTGAAVVPGAKLGDFIAWDWDPQDTADGKVDHIFMITGFDEQGAPLVSAQSNPVVDQRWQYTHDDQLIIDTKHVARAYLLHVTW